MKKIIFLASVWGILESTLGWLFHFIHFPSGSVMFPIGFIILMLGFTATNKRSTILLIGTIAAFIKLSNLLLPGAEFVYKPTISILSQSIIVAAIAPYINIDFSKIKSELINKELITKEVPISISIAMLIAAIAINLSWYC